MSFKPVTNSQKKYFVLLLYFFIYMTNFYGFQLQLY